MWEKMVVICFSGHAAYGHALKLGSRKDRHFVEGKIISTLVPKSSMHTSSY